MRSHLCPPSVRVMARRLPLALSAFLAVVLFAQVAPAGAYTVEAGGQRFGVQSRVEQKPSRTEPLQYHGGPVLHSSDTYAIYWDPVGNYRGDWQRLIDTYFQNVGAVSGKLEDVFAVDTQYADGGGRAANQTTFRGAYTDQDPYPAAAATDAKQSGTKCGEGEQEVPTFCVTDQEIRTELQQVIASGALPGATGPAVYYVLTPPGVRVCTTDEAGGVCSNSTDAESATSQNGICGYHSVINPGTSNPVIYAVQPWVAGDAGLLDVGANQSTLACQADTKPFEEPNQLGGVDPFGAYGEGLADVIINDLSIEQSNIVTNPQLNGWYQEHEGTDYEQGDMCQWAFGPEPEAKPTENKLTHAANYFNESINGNPYFVQYAFNSVGLTSRGTYECWSGVTEEPHFTAPNPVNAGDVVGFDATESNITLNARVTNLPADEPFTASSYRWNFGDGTVVEGTGDASEFHSYRYGGTYTVELTVTDSGGNKASFSEQVKVNGPSAPSAGGSGAGAAATTGSGSTGSTTGASGAGAAPTATTAGPVATQAVLSHSLPRALRKGLVVRYSVSEQATGHFEVLLGASTARRLGLHGPLATGLPAGTPAEIVIAKALVVTTKAGHSTMTLQFGKTDAKRLSRLHSAPLMLRLVVRGPSGGFTTVLSKVNLSA